MENEMMKGTFNSPWVIWGLYSAAPVVTWIVSVQAKFKLHFHSCCSVCLIFETGQTANTELRLQYNVLIPCGSVVILQYPVVLSV